jgi:putative (di)nucleoside polyphosphate hydrolase
MIDSPGNYRRNVGIAVFNKAGRVLVAERADRRGAWQLPQGGMDEGEEAWPAALRELAEEIGTADVTYLGEIEGELRYDFPAGFVGNPFKGQFIGQSQKWFAVRFNGQDSDIDLTTFAEVEFVRWRWAKLDEIAGLVVDFKRQVYEEVARQFAEFARPLS